MAYIKVRVLDARRVGKSPDPGMGTAMREEKIIAAIVVMALLLGAFIALSSCGSQGYMYHYAPGAGTHKGKIHKPGFGKPNFGRSGGSRRR